MVVVDAMEKAAGVRVLQAELNDQPGVSVKMAGALGDVRAAAEAAREIAARMQTRFVLDVIPRPDREALRAIEVAPDYQAILGQPMVQVARPWENGKKEKQVGRDAGFAVGLIEDAGFYRRIRGDRHGGQDGRGGSAGPRETGRGLHHGRDQGRRGGGYGGG